MEKPTNKIVNPTDNHDIDNPTDNPSSGEGPNKDGDKPTLKNKPDAGKDVEIISKEIAALKEQLKSTVKQEDIQKIIERLSVLTEELATIKRMEEERKRKEEEEFMKNLSETERLKYELKKRDEEIARIKKEIEEAAGKKAKELEEKLKQYEEQQKKLAEAAAKAKALETASRLGAYNPEQVYALIKDKLVTAPDGNVYARVLQGDEYVQIPVDEYLKEFLSRPENKNLLGTRAATGEGKPSAAEGTEPGGTKLEKDINKFFKSLPPQTQERLRNMASFSNRPLDDVIYAEYMKYKAAQRWRKKWQNKQQ